ncbi:ribokinase [Drosophila grimshawi]|uniref:Ribokinase n=1 Tax=Drosophila grimshawi TaxID=7222 RepID=B4JR11_DROGR|nr:ribokinase [Drosophila grimshawi]EDV99341.1 GH13082 [Drosophila grimshawi]
MKDNIDVLVFGSSNIDYITYVNELPKPGETVLAMHRERCFGGKGANQCVAASKLGANCALITKLGTDALGEDYLEYLKTLEINLDFVERVESMPTGLAEIIVSDNAENTIIVLPGANSMLRPKDVSRCKKLFKNAKVLMCQLETEQKAVLFALQQFKGISILNASPMPKNINVELITTPTILCINEMEAAQLTEREQVNTLQDAKAAANEIIDKGAKSVIITMGALGAVFLSSTERDVCIHCPAAPVRFLADTSGAGDAFLGSLAYHIAIFPNLHRESHISAANICAAYAVGHRGTQLSFPGPEYAQNDLCRFVPTCTVIADESTKPTEPETTPAPTKTETLLPPVVEPEPKTTATTEAPEQKDTEPQPISA